MKTLAALIPERSYAPELYALRDYLADSPDVRVELVPAQEPTEVRGFDGVYIKMGFAPRWKTNGTPEIHDYSSASTGRFRRTKDMVKSHMSRRPVLRSFLTAAVRERFGFRDGVPSVLRDMGVPDEFLSAGQQRRSTEEFDLFYAGSISAARRSAELFTAVEHAGLTLLAAGHVPADISERFGRSAYVTFSGAVPFADIPELAARCRFGINLTPDITPYNFQTSTKVVEYLALGLPVISNDYRWVRDFEVASGARIAKLTEIGELSSRTLEGEFVVPDMSGYSWRAIFDRSQIHSALRAVI